MKTPLNWKAVLVCAAIPPMQLTQPCCPAATLTVGPFGDKDYTRITAAVKAGADNDLIEVYPGQYDEPAIVLDKTLTIRGKYDPICQKIIGADNGFIVAAGVATIEALTVTKSLNGIVLTTPNAKCTVRNCLLLGNGGFAIRVDAAGSLSVLNSIIGYNRDSGIKDQSLFAPVAFISVGNSIFIGNTGYGFESYSSVPGGIDDSLFFNNLKGIAKGANLGAMVLPNADPKFRDVNKSDFRLQLDSPAVDAGDPSPASQDPDGTRNDIGIYGGPYARPFWYGPGPGPTVRDLVAIPPVVRQGQTFHIEGKAQVEPGP